MHSAQKFAGLFLRLRKFCQPFHALLMLSVSTFFDTRVRTALLTTYPPFGS